MRTSGLSPSSRRTLRLRLSLAIAMLGVFVVPALAQRRDFPANYTVSHVSEDDDGVHLMLSLTVRNFSGNDIEGSAIVLIASDRFSTLLGSFQPVKLLPGYRDVTVRHRFTVPKEEYERWQQGADPVLEIQMPDGNGGTVEERVDARRETPLARPAE